MWISSRKYSVVLFHWLVAITVLLSDYIWIKTGQRFSPSSHPVYLTVESLLVFPPFFMSDMGMWSFVFPWVSGERLLTRGLLETLHAALVSSLAPSNLDITKPVKGSRSRGLWVHRIPHRAASTNTSPWLLCAFILPLSECAETFPSSFRASLSFPKITVTAAPREAQLCPYEWRQISPSLKPDVALTPVTSPSLYTQAGCWQVSPWWDGGEGIAAYMYNEINLRVRGFRETADTVDRPLPAAC